MSEQTEKSAGGIERVLFSKKNRKRTILLKFRKKEIFIYKEDEIWPI